jgi:hypothetical protein
MGEEAKAGELMDEHCGWTATAFYASACGLGLFGVPDRMLCLGEMSALLPRVRV